MSTRRLTWLAFAVLLAARLALAHAPTVPRQLDELGYLAGARYLATGDGALEPTGRAPYKVGYSLLLAPFFWLGADVDTAFLATRLLGALLMASLLPLGAALAGRFEGELGSGERVALGAAVALSPAAVLYGTTAMSENLLLPGYLLYLLLAARAFEKESWARWAAWGAVAGGLYLVHERAIAWLLLAALACLLEAAFRRRWAPLAGLVAAGALSSLHLPVPGSEWSTGSSAAGYLGELFARPETLLATVVGHGWYLALASGGVLAGGLYLALVTQRCSSRLLWLTLLSSASMIALSIVLMGQRENARMTHWIYGRYSESVLPALVLLALAALWHQARRRRWRSLLLAGGLSTLSLALPPLVLRLLWTPEIAHPFAFNVPAVAFYQWLTGWGLLRVAAASLVLLVVLAAPFPRFPGAALWLFAAWQATAATVGYFDPDWHERNAWRERERHLVQIVQATQADALPGADLVCYDRSVFPSFHFYHYEFFLHPVQMQLADPAAPASCAGAWWITPHLERPPIDGARLVALETLPPDYPPFHQRLWVRPGALQDALEARGRLLPDGFPRALDGADLRSEIRLLDPVVSSGQELRLDVEHRGHAPWPHKLGLRRFTHRVALRVDWLDAEGRELEKRVIELPRQVMPGETVRLEVPPADLPAASYRLRLRVDQYLERAWAESAPAAHLFEVRIRP